MMTLTLTSCSYWERGERQRGRRSEFEERVTNLSPDETNANEK